MAAERVRGLEFPRPYGAESNKDVLQEQSARQLAAKVLPEWARGSLLLEGVSLTAGTVLYLPHQLGRKHRGWIVVLTTLGIGHETVGEIATSHASYRSTLAETHLQLLPTATTTASIVVF